MIIFDREKYINDINKNGISKNDYYAKQKLRDIMSDFIFNTSYKKSAICRKVKAIASDYFNGLPEDLVDNELQNIYEEMKSTLPIEGTKKIVTLYKSEMETIKALENKNLMKLAFVALVVHKHEGQYENDGEIGYYTYIKECKADIYRLAGLDSISGTSKNNLWHELSVKGLVKYIIKVNNAWRFNPKWLAMTLFTVPFNVDLSKDKSNEEVFMKITNYDDILLYLRYYLGDKLLTLCADCGCPILRNEKSRGKLYCTDCACRRKQESDNKRYKKRVA